MVQKRKKALKWVSLFSSAWIAEYFLSDAWIDIICANEIVPERASLYEKIYGKHIVNWDIMDDNIFNELIKKSWDFDFLIAWPPCQWVSVAWKNRTLEMMIKDSRNFLIKRVIEFTKIKKPSYILIENVPAYLKLLLPYKNKTCWIIDILIDEFWEEYEIEHKILDASDYWVPQKRLRLIIKLFKKWLSRWRPEKKPKISVKEAIWHLPSLESGDVSDIPLHYARKHTKNHVNWMRATPTGCSAIHNVSDYPCKSNWERIKSYESSYRRIKRDEPSPTITMRNDAISSQRNVHPWRDLWNGQYSDARVMTPLELIILSSIPEQNKIPLDTPEWLIRKCLWECIPPLLIKSIVEKIWE